MNGYLAEFIGTVIFLSIILIVIHFISSTYPKFLIPLLIGLGLFLGIYVCVLLGGPGYLNPAVAIMLGIKDNKGFSYTTLMIIVELLAVAVVLGVYYLIAYVISSNSSSA